MAFCTSTTASQPTPQHHLCNACAQVMPYAWGEDAGRLPQAPDVITGADVVYEQEHFPALISSLRMLAAPHTVIFLSYRLRGTQHGSLQGA